MKGRLTAFSLAVLLGLLAVTGWAGSVLPLGAALGQLVAAPSEGLNPWLWATLVDAYLAFFWFYAWIFYKEPRITARLGWLLAVLLGGNLAMAIYMLMQVHRLPAGATPADLLLRRKTA